MRTVGRFVAVAIVLVAACGGGDGDAREDDQNNADSCGGAQCETGERCCDHCAGVCVPEESGVQCPDDQEPGRSCDDAGTDEPSLCPDDPPGVGGDCPETGLVCTYQRCATEGVVTAECGAGGWTVVFGACEQTSCGSEVCAADQICLQQFSGAQLMTCAANPCGVSSLDCDCADALCSDDMLCSTSGLTVTCTVDCMGADCPP